MKKYRLPIIEHVRYLATAGLILLIAAWVYADDPLIAQVSLSSLESTTCGSDPGPDGGAGVTGGGSSGATGGGGGGVTGG